MGCFVDASFAADLIDSASTSGMVICLFGSRTFVPITWFCKKQPVVSHSSSESELVALDTALRMEGLPCLQFWDLVLDVFSARSDPLHTDMDTYTDGTVGWGAIRPDPFDVDYVTPALPPPKGLARMYVFEDNEAVIKMTIKGRTMQMRHTARTHRTNYDWVFERVKRDPCLFLKYVPTKEQMGDIFTKGNFTAKLWQSLLELHQVG